MTNEQEVRETLATITRLLAAQIGSDLKLPERADLLDRLGVDRATIAVICKTTPNAVNARISEFRRAEQAPRATRRSRASDEATV